jgi:hypothetical protein
MDLTSNLDSIEFPSDKPTKCQHLTGIQILIPTGRFYLGTAIDVGYEYYAFTYIPNQH